MTLRLRLVLSLVVLVAVGLAIFGLASYEVFANGERSRLDANLAAAMDDFAYHQAHPSASEGGDFGNRQPRTSAQGQAPPGASPFAGTSGPPPGDSHGPPLVTFNEKLTASGAVLYSSGDSAQPGPKLPSPLPHVTADTYLTLPSTGGLRLFRVLLRPAGGGNIYLVATPTTSVSGSIHSLIAIEIAGGAALLVMLSAGSWLLLRRGLRPIEQMAGTARSITAGDLSHRVSDTGPSEVGELGRAFNTMLDDIEAAFAEREATERRLRQFLADASHELRTPLTSIQGFAELFRVSGEDARVDFPTILRRIEQESARMKVLVEDLLLLARLDQPREAERQPVDLAVLAADACSDAVATAPDRPVTLDAPVPVVVAGDQGHLRQAIANLVSNSLRHTPPASPIEVSARLEDGSAVVSVRDHGPGLDDEALSHVFDRFWQADKARAGSGAGLGLAIVASIAAEHGGKATADNAAGGGAVFSLRLPLSASGAELVGAARN